MMAQKNYTTGKNGTEIDGTEKWRHLIVANKKISKN